MTVTNTLDAKSNQQAVTRTINTTHVIDSTLIKKIMIYGRRFSSITVSGHNSSEVIATLSGEITSYMGSTVRFCFDTLEEVLTLFITPADHSLADCYLHLNLLIPNHNIDVLYIDSNGNINVTNTADTKVIYINGLCPNVNISSQFSGLHINIKEGKVIISPLARYDILCMDVNVGHSDLLRLDLARFCTLDLVVTNGETRLFQPQYPGYLFKAFGHVHLGSGTLQFGKS